MGRPKIDRPAKNIKIDIWLMPQHRMHMTTLEVTHSKTSEEVESLVSRMRSAIPYISSFSYTHRSRLVKPMISYDLAAFAVSFLPASGEPGRSPPPSSPVREEGLVQGDPYTYHHLRRDVFDLGRLTGVEIASRYQVPSAHITLGRYLEQGDHQTPEMRERWVRAIDEINKCLEDEVWDVPSEGGNLCGEWLVGQERGLDARCGTLWYGGGRTIALGEGF